MNGFDKSCEVRKELIDGENDWYWIRNENGAWEGPKKDWEQNRTIYFEKLKNRRICVTAGANCGMYSRFYSKMFETVYAFEPEALNFHCLVQNTQSRNVIKMNAALGSENTFMNMKLHQGSNCGMHKMSGFGHIPMLALDTMNFPVLDFLQLDVEGFEEQALRGAEKTIRRTRPIIVVERDNTRQLLESYDYKFYKRSGHADYVWIPSEEI